MRTLLAIAAALALVATGLTTAAAPAAAVDTHRIAGANRFATAVEADRAMESVGGPVYLASGSKFPDALAAGPVVVAEGGTCCSPRRTRSPRSSRNASASSPRARSCSSARARRSPSGSRRWQPRRRAREGAPPRP
ncbi:cell wall-binding repeat-containing protein [Agrococcus sp. Ld7]|uniref:cell wall-binding repeat-containing protein n=1 Tax=Agrococcus sp. Ld7 TaxID=649148 RepID=UPI00386AE22C